MMKLYPWIKLLTVTVVLHIIASTPDAMTCVGLKIMFKSMNQEISKHRIHSHYQLIVDEFQNVIIVGYEHLTSSYHALVFEYAKTPCSAEWPLRDLVKKVGPFKEFQEVKKITSKYSKIVYVKGILGVIKFLYGYYLLYIQQAEQVGSIGDTPIYRVEKVSILPLFRRFNDLEYTSEIKHFDLLNGYEFSDLYFAYSYNLSSTLLQNINGASSDDFVWNHYLKEELVQCVGAEWTPMVMHGFYECTKGLSTEFQGVEVKFDVVTLSRRNRQQSGVRYLKRGINAEGFAANHVETEQIVTVNNTISSFLMVRGSVPVFWKQEPNIIVFQPKIQILEGNNGFLPAQKHFSDLMKRHGANIHCVNLLRTEESKPREALLTTMLKGLVNQISTRQKQRIFYYQFDVKKSIKNFKQFEREAYELSYYLILQTGISLFAKDSVSFQHGIARVNCVDCLDRTNLFMSILGEVALVFQLKTMMGQCISPQHLSLKEALSQSFSLTHQKLGNAISLQYGGSEAHKHRQKANKSQIMVSLIRHINNNTSDYIKQQQIDIFNGLFSRTKPFIWEREFKQTKEESQLEVFANKQWVEEAEEEYINSVVRKNMVRKMEGVLEILRVEFMKSKIPLAHTSLGNVEIEWGTALEYKIQPPELKPKETLKDWIHTFNNQVHSSLESFVMAESLLENVIRQNLNSGKIEESEFQLVEPFLRNLKKKNLI